jgi:hypothetical protein
VCSVRSTRTGPSFSIPIGRTTVLAQCWVRSTTIGLEYLCACASRSLNKHEKNYPSYKGELLALAWAVRSFRTHLHGTKFKLVTDYQPFTWLMKSHDLTCQYSRWQMLVQEYDFEICHRAWDKHQNDDVLPRFPRAFH